MEIVKFILEFANNVRDVGKNILLFIGTDVNIFGENVSVFSLICGGALVGFLIAKVAFWLINS